VPAEVVEPATAQDLARVLADASARGLATVVRGGGSKTAWGRVPQRVDLVLSTTRLRDTLDHRDGDLTATVSAGVRLVDLNARLAEKGQWLPVESPFPGTTIGGLVATNEAGPLRHRFGTPRDLLIGVTLALADGRLVKSGGVVVKNVAGYDLGRFVSGSLGTMAVIVDATFKLAPVLRSSVTVRVPCPGIADVERACRALAASQLEPVAVDLRLDADGDESRYEVYVRFASSPGATEAQSEALEHLLPHAWRISGPDEAQVWRDQVQLAWDEQKSTVRFSWHPSRLPDVLGILTASRTRCPGSVFVGRAALGTGLLALRGDAGQQAGVIETLRRCDAMDHVVLLTASRALKARVDVWGPPVPWTAPLAALKRSFDPGGILGAGRGPL
jgi:glycolate oxidase FAD binding subunit